MQVIRCPLHEEEFRLPSTEDEYISGKLHDDITCMRKHVEQYRDCKFIEVNL